MAADRTLSKARMFFDTFATSRLLGRRGAFYGISLRYRKDSKPFHEDLPKILALVARGEIVPVVAKVLPLDQARKALELLATGTVAGKIVLTCDYITHQMPGIRRKRPGGRCHTRLASRAWSQP